MRWHCRSARADAPPSAAAGAEAEAAGGAALPAESAMDHQRTAAAQLAGRATFLLDKALAGSGGEEEEKREALNNCLTTTAARYKLRFTTR